MPGERLMCIWQAVLSKDVFPESGVKRATVQGVVENFKGLPGITYTERRFKEVFTDQKVTFEQLVHYVDNDLRSPSSALLTAIGFMEHKCWTMCESSYESEALNVEQLEQMWYIFNRVCTVGSYPPVISKDDADWLFDKLATSLEKTWGSKDALPAGGMTLQEMINKLDKMYFSVTSTAKVRDGIQEIHTWLVKEIMKAGWLYKRTRKQSNWTNWQKRWFIMMPGSLTYYEQPNMKTLKGEVVLDRSSIVEDMSEFKGLVTRLQNRFNIANKPNYEIEMCAESPSEKTSWLSLLYKNQESVKTGVTPITALLRKRQASVDQQSTQELETSRQVAAKSVRYRKAATEPKQAEKAPVFEKPLEDDEGVYDNTVAQVQKDKVRAVFLQIDKDGNGRIDKNEFYDFLKGLGTTLDRREADVLFQGIDADGNNCIFFDEFYNTFLRMVLGETNTDEEAKLRTAFLNADRDGSGAVSFREFSEFAWSSRQSLAMDQLMKEFDALDVQGKGEIDYKAFRNFFTNQHLELTVQADPNLKQTEQILEDYLKSTYNKVDTGNMADYLRKRWKAFASFKRYDNTGKELVMTGAPGMVADVVPGSYNLIDLAMFNDLPPIVPKHVAVKGVTWIKSQIPGKSGRVLFPSDFSGEIPVDVATNEHLAYYGATLATGNQLQVSLLYRHGIQDFTYQNNYLDAYVTAENALGGAGIEHHDFAHLDCPLDDNSGVFIIAKWNPDQKDELHITGFKIPTRHTLYLPGGVIHSNDNLKGTWRTMLSDEAEIDHVQLTRVRKEGKVETHEKFTFKFV